MTGAPIDLLYRLTERDKAFPHWGPSFGLVSTTRAGSTSDSTDLAEWDASRRPPRGTILFITNLTMFASATTGGLIFLEATVQVLDRENDNLVADLLGKGPGLVAAPDTLSVRGSFDLALLMDRHYLSMSAEYSSSAGSKTISFAWAGYVVAQGEIGFS